MPPSHVFIVACCCHRRCMPLLSLHVAFTFVAHCYRNTSDASITAHHMWLPLLLPSLHVAVITDAAAIASCYRCCMSLPSSLHAMIAVVVTTCYRRHHCTLPPPFLHVILLHVIASLVVVVATTLRRHCLSFPPKFF